MAPTSTAHRNAMLATLRPEQIPVAEQLLRGGIPAVRQAIEAQNAAAKVAGKPPASSDALMAMAERVQQPDLLTAVIAIVQAERLGGNIVAVLEEISIEAREARMMRIEELAAQLPVKMVFPMALFMLPALVVMIFGPVVADFLSPK